MNHWQLSLKDKQSLENRKIERTNTLKEEQCRLQQ